MRFFRKKIDETAILTAPDNVVDIPAPTAEDTAWAKAYKGKIPGPALVEACKKGHLWRVAYAIESGTNKNFKRGNPLHVAVEHNHPETVKLLLAYKANVSAFHQGALRLAAQRENTNIINILFHYGATPRATKEALPFSESWNLNPAEKIFLDNIYKEFQANRHGIKEFKANKHGIDLEVHSPAKDLSPLIANEKDIDWAIKYKKLTTKHLIKSVKTGNLWRAQYIINKIHADNTILHDCALKAIQKKQYDCIRLLHANDLDLDNKNGALLHHAANYGHIKAIGLLIDLGANLELAIANAPEGEYLGIKDILESYRPSSPSQKAEAETKTQTPPPTPRQETPKMTDLDIIIDKIKQDNPITTVTGHVITIPDPTDADLKWAKKQKKTPSHDTLSTVSRTEELWRIAYCYHKGTNITEHQDKALRDTGYNQAAPSTLELLIHYGANLDNAIKYSNSSETRVFLKEYKMQSLLTQGPQWVKQDEVRILQMIPQKMPFDGGVKVIHKEFNFQARKIMSYIQEGKTISAPTYERFDEQPTNDEITQAHEELVKQDGTPDPLDEILFGMTVKNVQPLPISKIGSKAIKKKLRG